MYSNLQADIEEVRISKYFVQILRKDFLPLHGDGDLITVRSGNFVLLLPEDGHMPGMALGDSAPVKKIVIKISVE